jgi:phosphodiesterase/alkaline phosphatase D-like protein
MASFHRQVDGWLMELGASMPWFFGWLDHEIMTHE